MNDYKNIKEIARREFGDRIPDEYYTLIERIGKAEQKLDNAKSAHCVQPGHYNGVAAIKAELFDFLNQDGLIVIGMIPAAKAMQGICASESSGGLHGTTWEELGTYAYHVADAMMEE